MKSKVLSYCIVAARKLRILPILLYSIGQQVLFDKSGKNIKFAKLKGIQIQSAVQKKISIVNQNIFEKLTTSILLNFIEEFIL